MKKTLALIFLVAVMLTAVFGCAQQRSNEDPGENVSPQSVSSSQLVDAIQWKGATYVHMGNTQTNGEMIGIKLGEIKFKLDGSERDIATYQLQDGDAVLIESGTMVYQVVNSDSIAVKVAAGWKVYDKLDTQS